MSRLQVVQLVAALTLVSASYFLLRNRGFELEIDDELEEEPAAAAEPGEE